MIFTASGCIASVLRQKSTTQLKPTPMMRLWSSWGEWCGSTVVGWLAGWPVRLHWNAGSFVCLREEWVRGRMPLMIAERKNEPPGSALSLFPHPHSPTLILSPSVSLSLSFSVCENLHRAEPLSLRPRSPGTTTALSCPVNTHPSSTGRLCLPGPVKHRATAPILIHIAAPAWMVCMCVCVSVLNGNLFFMWHTHWTPQYEHIFIFFTLVYCCFVRSKSHSSFCFGFNTLLSTSIQLNS